MATYSDLKRSVPGPGVVWENGRYKKRVYISAALRAIWLNLKRLVNQEQIPIFTEVEESEGVTLPRESEDNTYYFNESSIHAGVVADPNQFAIWIDGKKLPAGRTGAKNDKYELIIYVTIGSGDFDTQIQLISVFLEGLANLIDAMDARELVFGWPAHIPENRKVAYQPSDISIKNVTIQDPDVAAGATADTKGPIGSVSFDVIATPRENK